MLESSRSIMNKTALLAIPIAAVAVVAAILVAAPLATASVSGPAWVQKTDGSVTQKNTNTATLTITTAGDIQICVGGFDNRERLFRDHSPSHRKGLESEP